MLVGAISKEVRERRELQKKTKIRVFNATYGSSHTPLWYE